MVAVWAHICPLTPCNTPPQHMPRTQQTKGAHLLPVVLKRRRISRNWDGSVKVLKTCKYFDSSILAKLRSLLKITHTHATTNARHTH